MADECNPMSGLFRRLEAFGISERQVRCDALPGWWNDAYARFLPGYGEALVYIARHYGLDPASLLDPDAPIKQMPADAGGPYDAEYFGRQHLARLKETHQAGECRADQCPYCQYNKQFGAKARIV